MNEYLERKVTSTDLKKMFLVDAEATFQSYFDEVFNARLQTGGATDGKEVKSFFPYILYFVQFLVNNIVR